MSILIAPITIDGTPYCVDEQGNNRTEVLLFDGAVDLGGNEYELADWAGSLAGSIKFGTICATEVTILLSSLGEAGDMEWVVKLNGITYDSGNTGGGGGGSSLDESVTVALTPTPCGNIIEVEGLIYEDADTPTIVATIEF